MTETDPTGEMYLVADELRSIAETWDCTTPTTTTTGKGTAAPGP